MLQGRLPRRAWLLAALALLAPAAGCSALAEEDAVEDALRVYAARAEFGADPPGAFRIESVAWDEYSGERFHGAQVYSCEVAASNGVVAGPLCVALAGGELFFGTGRADCLEGGFSTRW